MARRQQAKEAGATYVLDPTKTDVPAFCREHTEGRGVHATFECAGTQAAFDTALASLRGKGAIINISRFEKPLTIGTANLNSINRRSISYLGSNIYTRGEFQEVIDAIAEGRPDPHCHIGLYGHGNRANSWQVVSLHRKK